MVRSCLKRGVASSTAHVPGSRMDDLSWTELSFNPPTPIHLYVWWQIFNFDWERGIGKAKREEREQCPCRDANNLPICTSSKGDQNNIWFPQHLFIQLYIRKLSSMFPWYKSVPGSQRRGGGGFLNLTLESWLFWQPGGTAAGSRRQGATSNSLLWSGTVSPHMALISGCLSSSVRACLPASSSGGGDAWTITTTIREGVRRGGSLQWGPAPVIRWRDGAPCHGWNQ